MTAPMLLGVAGMVGTGKSTLTYALATRFGLQLAPESVDNDNPWLSLFYGTPGGMRAYALQLQLHFLATRFEALRQMRGKGGSWILDRTWYEDAEIFARGLHEEGLMQPIEFELYQRLYLELLHSPAARPPRLLLYLHGPLDTIVSRITQRGRAAEKETDHQYWSSLHERYAKWIAGFRHCPVMTLDIREYDLVRDPGVVDEIAANVRRRLEPRIPQTELWPMVRAETQKA